MVILKSRPLNVRKAAAGGIFEGPPLSDWFFFRDNPPALYWTCYSKMSRLLSAWLFYDVEQRGYWWTDVNHGRVGDKTVPRSWWTFNLNESNRQTAATFSRKLIWLDVDGIKVATVLYWRNKSWKRKTATSEQCPCVLSRSTTRDVKRTRNAAASYVTTLSTTFT